MMRRFSFVVLLLLAGCSTPPSHFYVLTPLETTPPHNPATPSQIGLLVGPVTLPEYLLRPQIALRNGNNEIRFQEFHRWAEPLHGNFSRVLTENLSRLLNSSRVIRYPGYRTGDLPYQVVVDVTQLDAGAGRSVKLVARWRILQRRDHRPLHTGESRIVEPIEGATPMAVVAAQSRALAQLSREIAEAIERQRERSP